MGHPDVQTTTKYPHYAPRTEGAVLVTEAFGAGQPDADGLRAA